MVFDPSDVLTPQLIAALVGSRSAGVNAGCGETLARARARCHMMRFESYRVMAETLRPDICVIGGGPGGLSVAAAAAAFGVPTVLIESRKMGGDSLNTGCVPSKALLAAAKTRRGDTRAPKLFGVDVRDTVVNFSKVHRHVHSVIAAVAPADSAERFTGLGVRVIHAHAKFKDRNTVVAGDIEIRARRFVIATGSTPALPAIPGLDSGPYLTNESIFDLTGEAGASHHHRRRVDGSRNGAGASAAWEAR